MEKLQKAIVKMENELKELTVKIDTIHANIKSNHEQLSELIADCALVSYTGTGDMTEIKKQQLQKLIQIRDDDTHLKCYEDKFAVIFSSLSVARVLVKNPEKYAIVIDNFTLWEEHHKREFERFQKADKLRPTTHWFSLRNVVIDVFHLYCNTINRLENDKI